MSSPSPDIERLRAAFQTFVAEETTPPDPDESSAEEIWSTLEGAADAPSRRAAIDRLALEPARLHLWRLARKSLEDSNPAPADVRMKPVRSPRGWALPSVFGLAAAAVLAAVMVTPPSRPGGRGGPGGSAAPEYRGPAEAAITPLPPVFQNDGSLQLRWQGPPASHFDLSISTPELRVVTSTRGLSRAAFVVSKAQLDPLGPAAELYWQVTLHPPDDGAPQTSPTFVQSLPARPKPSLGVHDD